MNHQIIYQLYASCTETFPCCDPPRGVGEARAPLITAKVNCRMPRPRLDWAHDQFGSAQLLIADFYFGAWIGMQLLMRRRIQGFISIAPATSTISRLLAPCRPLASSSTATGRRGPAQDVTGLCDKLKTRRHRDRPEGRRGREPFLRRQDEPLMQAAAST
jgi:alpha/beta superfamily hydrolase